MKMLYENEKGKEILNSVCKTIEEFGMQNMMRHGVVLGLSGGADSVMLLYTLIELRKIYGDFDIKCIHVNHMIRGADADDDEKFCIRLCEKLSVPLQVERVDVPRIAKEKGEGIEEAARNERYRIFENERRELSSDACIAVAHNATDNLETMIFNMMRGTGIKGLAGIKPVREYIIRPLISVSKEKIVEFLNFCKIGFVIDKTNSDTDYSRNFIRNDILPLLKKLSPDPEGSASRVSQNLREDISYIDGIADKLFFENYIDKRMSIEVLKELPKAIFSRVLMKIIRQKTDSMPEHVHIQKIYSLIGNGDFEYSLPGKIRFVSRGGYASIEEKNIGIDSCSFFQKLYSGVNVIQGFDHVIILSDKDSLESYSNVYKIEIQATLPSDIIEDGIYLREKRDGDSYCYGGLTHKLKKLFSDRKIPTDLRRFIPIICDKSGIVWVPGFGVRNEESGIKRTHIAIARCVDTNASNKKFHIIQRK